MKQNLKSVILALFMTIVLTIPAFAGTDGQYIFDEAGLLDEVQMEELSARAIKIAESYGCAAYVVTVEDFTEYGSDSIDAFAQEYFLANGFGLGETQNGVMLALSMRERDYCLLAHGDLGNAAFTDYGKDVLAEIFLDDLGLDNWYVGFDDYLIGCGDFLETALDGDPIDVGDEYKTPLGFVGWLIAIGAGCLISLIICLIMGAQMNTAVKQSGAKEYLDQNGINIRERTDVYTHSTQKRRKIEKQNNSSGGSSRSSGGGGTTTNRGGFSSKSGKF